MIKLSSAFAFTAFAVRCLTTQEVYDYIVIGSGPGGGPLAVNLARAGYKTLLLEAGDDLGDDPTYNHILNNYGAVNGARGRWDFFVQHSEDPAEQARYALQTYRTVNGSFYTGLDPPSGAERLGIWYPRGASLGGCSMNNAAIATLPPDADWEIVVNRTGDRTWLAENMRQHFIEIERNEWFPRGTPGHGFDGYLRINTPNNSWTEQPSNVNRIIAGLANATDQDIKIVPDLVVRDINAESPDRDQQEGFYGMSLHIDSQGFQLVTRVLFDDSGLVPVANGVEVLQGQSVYKADPRWSKDKKSELKTFTAKREVIVSGGAFNSPQILKHSGVGPADELNRFGIKVIKDLPGVGENLAENYEGGLLGLASQNINLDAGQVALVLRTPTETGGRNIHAWCGPFALEGFWPGMPKDYGPRQWSRAGSVRLKSADPTDTPDINFRFWQVGGDEDLREIVDAVNIIRQGFNAAEAPVTPWSEIYPCHGNASNCTDQAQLEYFRSQSFGHHASSSCAIGAAEDPMAVVDSKFRVHGVKNLRVVDASVFPHVPDAFPVLPTLIISQKASKDIIEAASSA
ncbi:alcohol dehydrogenase [Colletotrichum truncatum]|uniref:Alcohol dehydrogenase n=1 Tax=Colletotrichum truncatum TaxID=5467 RepID=A0ACC3YRE7_COLTU|nr:alcohol dehydrogenase [Colletotrichum truncatum]KAF6799213.1 alcohol dehydrogenase [Colletotrichum truncatum]